MLGKNQGLWQISAEVTNLPKAKSFMYGDAGDGIINLKNSCCDKGRESGIDGLPCLDVTDEEGRDIGHYIISEIPMIQSGMAYFDPASSIGKRRRIKRIRILPSLTIDTVCLSDLCKKPKRGKIQFTNNYKTLGAKIWRDESSVCVYDFADTEVAPQIGQKIGDWEPENFILTQVAMDIMSSTVDNLKSKLPEKIYYGHPNSTDPYLRGNMYGLIPQLYYADRLASYPQKSWDFSQVIDGQYIHFQIGGAQESFYYDEAEYLLIDPADPIRAFLEEIAEWVNGLDNQAFSAVFGADYEFVVTSNDTMQQVAGFVWVSDTDEFPELGCSCGDGLEPLPVKSETLPQYWDETPLLSLKYQKYFSNNDMLRKYYQKAISKSKKHFSKILGKAVRDEELVVQINEEHYKCLTVDMTRQYGETRQETLTNDMKLSPSMFRKDWSLKEGDFVITLKSNVRIVNDGDLNGLNSVMNYVKMFPDPNCDSDVIIRTKLPLDVVVGHLGLVAFPMCGNPVEKALKKFPLNLVAIKGCLNCIECPDKEATPPNVSVCTKVTGTYDAATDKTTITVMLDAQSTDSVAFNYNIDSSIGQLQADVTTDTAVIELDGNKLPITVYLNGSIVGGAAGSGAWEYVLNTNHELS